uniref:Plastid lipid-associated protein/fibrillin conserved domain-containing protein n=1 Tax=Lactuca sativa TaxID=4236 RepID=A0A9R1WZS3_LACSA|nr:hypothetical protein LSAT_V11C800438830 [Lactuca sativa]
MPCTFFILLKAFRILSLYTAFSELLPLLALGITPLLEVEKICQQISATTLTINNSITFSTLFATFTSISSANFEVRSTSRIQMLLSPKKMISGIALHPRWQQPPPVTVKPPQDSLDRQPPSPRPPNNEQTLKHEEVQE